MHVCIFLRLFLAVRAGTDRGAAMLKPVVNLSAGSQRSSLAALTGGTARGGLKFMAIYTKWCPGHSERSKI